MKLLWRIIFILAALIAWVGYSHPDWIVDPPFVSAATCAGNPVGKCEFNPAIIDCLNDGSCAKDPGVTQTPVSDTSGQPTAQSDTFKGK